MQHGSSDSDFDLRAVGCPASACFGNVMRRHPRWFAAAKYVILSVYSIANLYETILFRTVRANYKAEWELLWSYRESLAFPDGLMSLINGTVEVTRPALLEEIILNILLYVPLGYLLPFIFEKLKPWQVVAIAFCCSALTEVTQLVCKIGLFEFDDMLNNTMGCVIGLLIYKCIIRRRVRKSYGIIKYLQLSGMAGCLPDNCGYCSLSVVLLHLYPHLHLILHLLLKLIPQPIPRKSDRWQLVVGAEAFCWLHQVHHVATDIARLAGGQVAVVAVLEVDAQLAGDLVLHVVQSLTGFGHHGALLVGIVGVVVGVDGSLLLIVVVHIHRKTPPSFWS